MMRKGSQKRRSSGADPSTPGSEMGADPMYTINTKYVTVTQDEILRVSAMARAARAQLELVASMNPHGKHRFNRMASTDSKRSHVGSRGSSSLGSEATLSRSLFYAP